MILYLYRKYSVQERETLIYIGICISKIQIFTKQDFKTFQVGDEVTKYMTAVHQKIATINRVVGQLESPYNPSPTPRHEEYPGSN